MTYYVYKLTQIESGKSYIGKTYDLHKRLLKHLNAAKNGSDFHFHRALRKYGNDSFQVEVLWKGNEKDASDAEIYFISKFDTYYSGYNMTGGGDGTSRGCGHPLFGIPRTEKTKRKISDSLTGYKHNDIRNTKISNSLKGKPKNITHRANIARANKGKPLSNERKNNISIARRSKWRVKTPSGEIVLTDNLKKFCLDNNLNYNSWKSCKSKTYKGYTKVLME